MGASEVLDPIAAATKALDRAKLQLMLTPDSAFFTTVCFSMRHKIEYVPGIDTAATDGKHIWFNPDFLLSLTPPQQLFLLLHETLHCAYMHMLRGEGLDPEKFNRAADYVINDQLIMRGFEMPECGLYDPQYRDMSAEQIYKLLPDNPPPPPNSSGGSGGSDPAGGNSKGPGDFGTDLRSPVGGEGGVSKEDAEADMNEILVRAQLQSKMSGDKPGSIPGEIEIFINQLLDPKLPWYRILHKYMNQFDKTNHSFRKPNRRFFPKHILPSAHGEVLQEVAFAVDASLSVSDDDFLRFISEIHGIMRRLKPKRIRLLQFDSRVRQVDTIKSTNELSKVEFKGRGGTKIGPVLSWAEENNPTLLIIFSDGHFYQPEEFPGKSKLLFIIHDNPDFKTDLGKVIHYTIDT